MDQSKVNPFVGNTETSAGGSPVSVSPADPAANTSTTTASATGSVASTTPANSTQPSYPVNPYAPAGAPYAPGSNTPAPDYYDSSNNTYTYSDGPAVPNTGFSSYPSQEQDIYIPSDTPEKPKLFTKKFIIIASIGIFLIAAAVVAGLLIQGKKKESGNSSANSTSSLDVYMNYILYGTDSDTKIQGIPDSAGPIFIEKALGNINNVDINAAKLMIDKWQTFLSKYSTAKPEAIKNFIENNQTNIDFFKAYVETQPLTEEDIIKDYFNGNTEREYFEQKYSRFNKISNFADKYVDNQINYALAILEKIKIYQNYGCMTDQNFDTDCMSTKELSDQEEDIITENRSFYYAATKTYNIIVGKIGDDSWLVYDAISNIKEWEEP